MHRPVTLRLIGGLLAAVAFAACIKGPAVQHPLNGATRYLCCNLYYDKDKTTDANWQAGIKVPFGTPVHIDQVRRDSIEFTPEGHPTITLSYKYGDKAVPFETYFEQLLVENDPHAKLKRVPAKRVEAIERGQIEKGMTKEQVLLARGIPPGNRTPSLDSPTWTYWRNRWDTMTVYFVGDKVERVSR
jgi:hypothetical protein